MVEASRRPMFTYRTPSLPPRSEARTRVNERPSSSAKRRPLKTDAGSETATHQTTDRTAEAATSHALVIPPSHPRNSSEVTASPSDEDQSSTSGEGEPEYTISATTSRISLIHSETRIFIEPSLELQAMQTVQSHSSQSPERCRKLFRYLNRSQVSVFAPEVYIPSGYPGPLANNYQPARPIRETRSTPPVEPDSEPSYGPSREDIESLLNRQREWDDRQHSLERRNSKPLTRLTSLRREWSGSIKRTLSLGTRKKSFEPRMGEREEDEVGELGRQKSVLKEGLSRSKSVFERKEGNVGRSKSVFQRKEGPKRPWTGRRAHTLGTMGARSGLARGGDEPDLRDGRAENAVAVGREDSKYEEKRGER